MTQSVSDATAEKLLHDLVAVYSPSRHEAQAVQCLVDWMAENGYHYANIDNAGNAVGIIGSGPRQIVLLGHIDTFPGMPPVRLDGRRLYGRGSVDAKGPLCTFAAAAARAELPDDVQVVVVGAVEEEAATSKGARHVLTQYQPEICVIGEPSNWDRITLGYKGRLLLDWRWEGPLAHSAGPTLSPAEHAIAYWERVRDYSDAYNQDRESEFSRLSPSVRDINTRQEGVNGVAEMTIGFRLPPGIAPDDIAASLPPGEHATVNSRGAELAYAADKNSSISRVMRGAIRREGGNPRFVNKTGTSDMNVVGPVWDCPIVAYGPGDSALDHTPDEHIDLDEYLRAIRVLTDALENL